MSAQKRSELLRTYFGNAMQLAYIHEAVADYLETRAELAECERRLASARAARRQYRERTHHQPRPCPALHAAV
jgi:hypothetical protein